MDLREQLRSLGFSKREIARRMRVRLEPTEKECAEGIPGSERHCQYALDMRRQFPTAKGCLVRPHLVTLTDQGFYWHYTVPNKAAHKIMDHDGGAPVRSNANVAITLKLADIASTTKTTAARKAQINAARAKRKEEGRPDRVYPQSTRVRMAKAFKAAKAKAKAKTAQARAKAARA